MNNNEPTITDVIYSRSSTRCYDETIQIDHMTLRKILQAGMRAPSSKNRQPWHYTVIVNKQRLREIADMLILDIDKLRKYREMKKKDTDDLKMAEMSADILKQVSALVLVGYERDESIEHYDPVKWEISAPQFEIVDTMSIGASVENMILQAEALGVSSLWMCDILFAHDSIRKKMDLKYPFIAAVGFGYKLSHGTLRKPIEEKVDWIYD